MAKPYIYNDLYLNLGEIGEHEMQITAVCISQWDEPVEILIAKALVFIRRIGEPTTTLDVTSFIKSNQFWVDKVKRSYLEKLSKDRDWDEFAG